MSDHYSLAHAPIALSNWAKNMARVLSKRYYAKGATTYPVFVYRGMSGITSATALLIAISQLPKAKQFSYGVMYCRKYTENTNGNRQCETHFHDHGDASRANSEMIFVDDFVCSGESFLECARLYSIRYNRNFVVTTDTVLCLTGSYGGLRNYNVTAEYTYLQSLGNLLGVATVEGFNRYLSRVKRLKWTKASSVVAMRKKHGSYFARKKKNTVDNVA